MKKLLFGLVATIMLSNVSFSQNENENFQLSKEFSICKNNLLNKGAIVDSDSFSLDTKIFGDEKLNIITYQVYDVNSKNLLKGILQATINENSYLVTYASLEKYSYTSNSGIITTFDILKNKELVEFNVDSNKLIDYKVINDDIKNNSNRLPGGGSLEVVPCDGNNNGDLSFGECYKCMTDAIASDGFNQFVCDFPLLGWFSCWGSKSIACAYLAANY